MALEADVITHVIRYLQQSGFSEERMQKKRKRLPPDAPTGVWTRTNKTGDRLVFIVPSLKPDGKRIHKSYSSVDLIGKGEAEQEEEGSDDAEADAEEEDEEEAKEKEEDGRADMAVAADLADGDDAADVKAASAHKDRTGDDDGALAPMLGDLPSEVGDGSSQVLLHV